MALHYTILARVFAGCPVVVCLDPVETGKSTAIKAALSLFGMYFFIQMLTPCLHNVTYVLANRIATVSDVCEGHKCLLP